MHPNNPHSVSLQDWLNSVSSDHFWYIKRLSCNDTGQSGGHQSGIYIPNDAAFTIFPILNDRITKNPDVRLQAHIESHNRPAHEVRGIYYNNRFSEGGNKKRNECRITRWKSSDPQTPLQASETTGALTLFAFERGHAQNFQSPAVKVWICQNAAEEEYLEDVVGHVYPGECLFGASVDMLGGIPPLPETAPLGAIAFPDEWKTTFPSGAEIVRFVCQHDKSLLKLSPDARLLKRRDLEFKLFRMIEDEHLLPKIQSGFTCVDDFIQLANSVSNRRKSRGGRSFELHLEQIFREQGLTCFTTQAKTEGNKKPDFLFPSEENYRDPNYPAEKLRMLAVKTTCKDRWRQILNEANRVERCHLVTLQEGVSENQFREMEAEGVILVVPAKIQDKYPPSVRDKLLTLEGFIAEMLELHPQD